MEKDLENLKEEILTELPPASQLVDSLLKTSNEVLRKFIDSGYKEMLQNIECYLNDPGSRDNTVIQNAVQWAYMQSCFWPVKEVSDICDSLRKEKAPYEIIETVTVENPILGNFIKHSYFNFESIKDVDDRLIQRMLREVYIENLAIALTGSSEEVKKKIFSNLSKGGQKNLEYDMVRVQNAGKDTVELHRDAIVSKLRYLMTLEF